MAEQLQCKHKHKHVRRNNEGGCHATSHEICEFRIHSISQPFIKKLQQFFLLLGLELQFYFFFCEIENIPKTTLRLRLQVLPLGVKNLNRENFFEVLLFIIADWYCTVYS